MPTTDNTPKNPPVISFGFIQTAASFTLDQFNQTQGERTNRGTVFLVPAETGSLENNKIEEKILLASNNHAAKNEPQPVYCKNELYNGFACSALIKLPAPVGGDDRSSETFMLVVSLPYAQTATDFAIELCTSETCEAAAENGTGGTRLPITGVQVSIDSTGRANDLYRRIEARVDSYDISMPMTSYTIQLLGDSGSLEVLNEITTEYGL